MDELAGVGFLVVASALILASAAFMVSGRGAKRIRTRTVRTCGHATKHEDIIVVAATY